VTGRARGFTLTECLVALVVLSLGLLGAAAMLLGGLRGHAAALREFAALGLARDMAELILANGGAGAADLAAFLAASGELPPRGGAQGSVTVVPASGADALDQYEIRVTWSAEDGIRDSLAIHVLAQPVTG
jgi:type IV pilus modification protein PilV